MSKKLSTVRFPCIVVYAIAVPLLTVPARSQQSFSLSAAPGRVYLDEHGIAATSITVEPANGFGSVVSLSVSGLPAGVLASFKPAATTGTSRLVFEAGKVAVTGVTTLTVTGTSGSLTAAISIPLAVSAAGGAGGVGTVVDLTSSYNVSGIYANGTGFATGGLDGVGWAYSANLLTPSRIYNGIQFNFGPPNAPDAVSGTGQPILLPMGRFRRMAILATGVEGNQTAQILKVTYTDGTSQKFALNCSDWFTPQSYPDEYEAVTMPYRVFEAGTLDARGNFYLYAHFVVLDGAKFVETLTLPVNRDLVLLGVTLLE